MPLCDTFASSNVILFESNLVLSSVELTLIKLRIIISKTNKVNEFHMDRFHEILQLIERHSNSSLIAVNNNANTF